MNTEINNKQLQHLIEYADTLNSDFSDWVQASQQYYNNTPIIDDEEFDLLTEQLTDEFESDQTEEGKLIYQILTKGIQLSNDTFRISHTETTQLSLKKIKYGFNTPREVIKFINPLLKPSTILYAPKFDGISLKIKFNNIHDIELIQTRGGQDITQLLKDNPTITYVVSILKNSVKYRDVRTLHGELLVRKSVFKEKYSDTYKNPRNAINGILKTNPNDLEFVPCTDGINPIIIDNISVWKTYNTNLHLEQTYFNALKVDSFPFQTDGIVIANVIDPDKFVIKENYPTNIVAVKFKSETAQTKVIGIEWTIKKTGKLTPVLLTEPTKLDGSEVSKASCYSYDTLLKLKCGIGATVLIKKSGDIIPVIDKVIQGSREFNLPDNYKVQGKHIFSVGESEDVKEQKFILGLKCLNLEGIGPTISAQIGEIVDFDIIEVFNKNHLTDINIKIGSGSNLEKFRKIYEIQTLPLDQLIECLQLNGIGKTSSRKFAELLTGEKIDTKGLNQQLLFDTCKTGGTNNTIIKNAMEKLKSYGIRVIKPLKITEDMFSFEMTGNPPGMTKNEFVSKLKVNNPNALHTTLTKDTKYLFVDSLSSNSSKVNKARKYNITIMTYEDALKHNFNE